LFWTFVAKRLESNCGIGTSRSWLFLIVNILCLVNMKPQQVIYIHVPVWMCTCMHFCLL